MIDLAAFRFDERVTCHAVAFKFLQSVTMSQEVKHDDINS